MLDKRQSYAELGRPPSGAAAGTAERAPLAAAAVLGVLAGGAAFLAFAMSRPDAMKAAPPVEAAAPPISIEAAVADTARRAAGRAPKPAETSAPAPGATPLAAPSNQTPAVTAATTPVGAPPRLNPARVADSVDDFVAPRLKPVDGLNGAETNAGAALAVAVAPPRDVLSFASVWVADVDDRAPPFFFESDARGADAALSRPFPDGDIAAPPREERLALAKGETFVDALRRANIRSEDRNEAALAFGKLYNMRRLRPGQILAVTIAEPNRTFFQSLTEVEPPANFLLAMDFRPDAEKTIKLERGANGAYAAREIATPLTTRIAAVQGPIVGSLYLSAKKQGAPDAVIAGLAQMFAYDVDFQREIFGGDEFEALFEVKFDEAGNMVGGGDILFGRLKWRGRSKEKGYYRYATSDGDGKADYFDASGEGARRLLMKTPIDGARLSSGFGTRRHPILGYQKAHKGVDFAASRGTPIMAAGDGVVERAGPYGSFGNYVRIRHAQGYKTAYAHMNGIRKGVRTGSRVRQGDIIGYVGSTGRSTGPHLHYEVHLKDTPVNPQNLKIATGVELGGAELKKFREVRDRINALRTPHVEEDRTSLLADAPTDKDAL